MVSENNRNLLIRWILPALGTVLAVAALSWLYQDLDLARFAAAVAGAEWPWLLALAGTIVLEHAVRGWKWRQILFDLKPIASRRLLGAILAGYGAAIIVPLGISPLVRSWLVARLEDLRWASVLTSAAIERFLDGIVFALFAAFVALVSQIPNVEGNVRIGLAIAAGLNLVLFAGLLFLLFVGRRSLGNSDARISRLIDRLATMGGRYLEGLRAAILEGIVWPGDRFRQLGAVMASFVMKLIAATYFLWAGLAVGIVLPSLDYLFLMVF